MKILLELEAPGFKQSDLYEPTVSKEIGAFVSALVKSRTRGPEPRVTVVILGKNDVIVDAEALLRLQTRANLTHEHH